MSTRALSCQLGFVSTDSAMSSGTCASTPHGPDSFAGILIPSLTCTRPPSPRCINPQRSGFSYASEVAKTLMLTPYTTNLKTNTLKGRCSRHSSCPWMKMSYAETCAFLAYVLSVSVLTKHRRSLDEIFSHPSPKHLRLKSHP